VLDTTNIFTFVVSGNSQISMRVIRPSSKDVCFFDITTPRVERSLPLSVDGLDFRISDKVIYFL